MNQRTMYVLLIYAFSAAVLLFSTLINQRAYQDTWILQDTLIPTLLYVLIFAIVTAVVEDNKIIAIVCSSFTITLNSIPNLKYQMFYGTYDSVGHFGFVKNLLSFGNVPETGVYSLTYSDFPGMHILISALSLITGGDVNGSIKFIVSIIGGVVPLMTYFTTNRVFDRNIQKFILVASGFPVVMFYTLTGTTFGTAMLCLFFFTFFRRCLSKENSKKYTLILVLIGFNLLFSHAVTMLSLILYLCTMLVLMNFSSRARKTSSNIFSTASAVLILLSVSFVAWLMFRANFVFETFIESVKRALTGSVIETPIPQRLFEIPLQEQLKIFTLKYIKDAMILMFSLAGFLVLLKKYNRKSDYIFSNFFLPLTFLVSSISFFLVLQFAMSFGEIEYSRFINYIMLFSPFFVGLFLWHLNKFFKSNYNRGGSCGLFTSLIIFACISISIIQIFPYQPLVPRASVLSNGLPESEYVVDLRMVNTIYQEKMIKFAEKFSPNDAIIASDRVTKWQINGFASVTFSSKHIGYSPLQLSSNKENKQWDLFLLHYCGKSGPLSEKVEYRTQQAINEVRNNWGNTIYDNGESFIMSR